MIGPNYKLVNLNRPFEFLSLLHRAYGFNEKIKLNCSDEDFEAWYVAMYSFGVNYSNNEDNLTKLAMGWTRSSEMDVLTYNEALLLLIGLQPSCEEFLRFDLSPENTSQISRCKIELMFFNSEENNFLKRKYHTSSINMEDFLNWAIEKKFIERTPPIQTTDNQPGFSAYNDYRSWAKAQNTKILLKDLNNYSGPLSPSALLSKESTTFYQKLKVELVSTDPDQIKTPKPKTLLNYLSDYTKTLEEAPNSK